MKTFELSAEKIQGVKIFDCTIRDGGLVNGYYFTDEFVSALYKTCIKAGIDYMEIGKIVSPTIMSTKKYGTWNFCRESDLRRIIGNNETDLKIAVMADIGRTLLEEIIPKSESVVDMIRVATYVHQIPEAIELVEDAHAKGYETSINIMAISTVTESELDEALKLVNNSSVDVVYIADSFGTFYVSDIKNITDKYRKFCPNKQLGIHTHNNQQLAFANTVESILQGVEYIDVTVSGLGRGAGNCAMEILIGLLEKTNNRFHQAPILEFLEKYIISLKSSLDWGYSVPYLIAGQQNQHPKEAMKFIDDGRSDYLGLKK